MDAVVAFVIRNYRQIIPRLPCPKELLDLAKVMGVVSEGAVGLAGCTSMDSRLPKWYSRTSRVSRLSSLVTPTFAVL